MGRRSYRPEEIIKVCRHGQTVARAIGRAAQHDGDDADLQSIRPSTSWSSTGLDARSHVIERLGAP